MTLESGTKPRVYVCVNTPETKHRAFRARPWIASLELVALLAVTAVLSGIIVAGVLVGILDLVSTAGH